MGMTYEEFWHGEPELAAAYRKATEIKREETLNAEVRTGRYVFEALLSASPAFREFSKGIDHEYPTEPLYSFKVTDDDVKEQKERAAMNLTKAQFEAFAMAFNEQRAKEK